MDFNRFTEKLQEAVRAAQSIAIKHGHQQIDLDHLFAALLEQEGGLRATAEALDQENDRLAARFALAGAERELAVSERRLLLAVGWLTEPC